MATSQCMTWGSMPRSRDRVAPIRAALAIAGLSIAAFVFWYILSVKDVTVLFNS